MSTFGKTSTMTSGGAHARQERKSDHDRQVSRPFNVLRSFALLSVVVIAAIGIVSAIVILKFQEQYMMERDVTVTTQFVQSLAEQEFSFPHADDFDYASLLSEIFLHVGAIPNMMRVNVFDRQGKVVWSTYKGLIGRQVGDNSELAQALAGEVVYSLVRKNQGRKREHAFVPAEVSEFLEIYVPVIEPVKKKVVGAVEMYKMPTALLLALKRGRHLVWAGGVSGAVILYLSLFWIVQRASRVIQGQHAQLAHEVEKHKRVSRELQRSEHVLRELSGKLLGAQEQERKRIAAELHDGLGQSLSAIKFNLERGLEKLNRRARGGDDIDLVESSVAKVRDAVEEVRRISMDLRPSILDDLGILATIEWFCRGFQQVYPHIAIDKHLTINEDAVPDMLKIVIYRITQEALNNVAKHAEADRVELVIAEEAEHIRLSIRDNGRGFNVEPAIDGTSKGEIKGVGLQSMRERAELSGGEFNLDSSPDAGTTIEVVWLRRANGS